MDRVDFEPAYYSPFDRRVLDAYNPDIHILQKAKDIKCDYDAAMLRIMAQLGIKTEFEVWTSFSLSRTEIVKEFKLHEQLGALFGALRDQYREACFQAAGGKTEDKSLPFITAMYKVTAEEVTAAVRAQRLETNGTNSPSSSAIEVSKVPLMSFPWIFQRELGQIAQRNNTIGVQPNSAPQGPPQGHPQSALQSSTLR